MTKYNAMMISVESIAETSAYKIKQDEGLHEKACIPRFSRLALCESVAYLKLNSTCILYWSTLKELDLSYTVFYFQKLKDGNIARGCSDKTVKILDAYLNKIVNEFTGHSDVVRVIIEMSNGDLAVVSLDSKALIWDRNTGEQKLVYSGHTDYVIGLAELGNEMMVSGGYDKAIKVWNPTTGELIYNHNEVYQITVINILKSNQIAVSYMSLLIEIWNSDMNLLLKTLPGTSGAIYSITELSNTLLASGFDNGIID